MQRMADGEVVPPGTGDGQLSAIFDKLDQSGYKGYLSLEPHLANFAGLGSLEKDAAVRAENDTEKAFCIAYPCTRRTSWKIIKLVNHINL